MATELSGQSKTALAKAVTRLQASKDRQKREAQSMGTKLSHAIGGITAGATAAAVGIAEGRFRNRDGTPLSVGPIPLPLAAGAAALGLSWWWNPGNQVSAAYAGCMGAYAVSIGRGWGKTWRAKAGVQGIGHDTDDLSPAEAELVFGDED